MRADWLQRRQRIPLGCRSGLPENLRDTPVIRAKDPLPQDDVTMGARYGETVRISGVLYRLLYWQATTVTRYIYSHSGI